MTWIPIPESRTEHLTEHGRRVEEALWRVGSHERLYAFLVYEDELSPEDYWPLLADVWIHHDFTHADAHRWRELLTRGDLPGRERMMTAAEGEALEGMPDILAIYRGFASPHGDGHEWQGFAWTIQAGSAAFFARFANSVRATWCGAPGGAPYVATAEARRSDVLAYFTARNEAEVLILPERVRLIQVEPVELFSASSE